MRVVKTSIGSASTTSATANFNFAPCDFPIQFRCIKMTRSGHPPSSSFKSSSSWSEYAVVFRNHCSISRDSTSRSEEHTSELQSHLNLVCRLLLEKKKQRCRHQPHLKLSRHPMPLMQDEVDHAHEPHRHSVRCDTDLLTSEVSQLRNVFRLAACET